MQFGALGRCVVAGAACCCAATLVILVFTHVLKFTPTSTPAHRASLRASGQPQPALRRKAVVLPNSVAVLVPARASRGITKANDLALFQHLLPTFFETFPCEAGTTTFAIYIGYDAGDPFYDDKENLQRLRVAYDALWAAHAGGALGYDAPSIILIRLVGMAGAPCWIWNILAERAYNDGFDYLFQVNDDNRLMTGCWATRLKNDLQHNSDVPGFGVAGPVDLNNPQILTQAMVHRTHIDIFGKLYPDSFRNWYSDDWLTHVYGPQHTTMDRDVIVVNAQSEGTRYQRNEEAKGWVADEIERGQRLVERYAERVHGRSIVFT